MRALLCREAADPDARRGGFAEVNGFSGGTESHRFVIFAFFDAQFRAGSQVQSIQKFQKLAVFFVDADDFRFVFGAEVGKQDGALFAKFGNATANRNAVRATTVITKSF